MSYLFLPATIPLTAIPVRELLAPRELLPTPKTFSNTWCRWSAVSWRTWWRQPWQRWATSTRRHSVTWWMSCCPSSRKPSTENRRMYGDGNEGISSDSLWWKSSDIWQNMEYLLKGEVSIFIHYLLPYFLLLNMLKLVTFPGLDFTSSAWVVRVHVWSYP